MEKTSYDREFKIQAVKLVTEQGLKASQASKELGVSESAMHKWIKEFGRAGKAAFPGSGNLKPEDQKIKELEKRVRQLEMERDILKKATAYFAKESL